MELSAEHRLTATDSELNLVQFDYDANGQLTLLTDAKGNETTWQYDVLGRTIRKDYDDGNFEQYFYDAANQLTSYRQPNASVIAYEYDTRGNVTKVDYPSMADVTFTYDKMNRAVTMTDALGTTTNAYDLMSRPTSIGGLWANDAVTYDYDNLGRQDEISLNGRTVTIGYDNLSRLNAVNRGTDTFAYSYKSNGSQLDEVDLPNGAKSTFSYDGLGRLTQIQDLKSTAANISKFAYGYDNRDVKTHAERALGTATTQRINYTYDDIDQLLTEISTELTPVVNNNFTYDAAQNRTASTVDIVNSSFTINNVNQISAYTLGGSPVTVTHDDNGNTTQLGPKDLTWDDANRLTSVTVAGVSKTEYQYDGLDRRRIAKAYTWNSGTSDWVLQDERRFIYDGMDLAEERDGSNNLVAFYTRTGNIGQLLSRTTPTNTFYYHYDGNGNVVSLTDSSENVVATYEYDAYGNLQTSSGVEATNNPFRFSTKYFDAQAGFYDYGFRFYDPVTGRWLSRDPMGEDGGINLYAFVGNGPVNSWDELGLEDLTPNATFREALRRLSTDPTYAKEMLLTLKETNLYVGRTKAIVDTAIGVASAYETQIASGGRLPYAYIKPDFLTELVKKAGASTIRSFVQALSRGYAARAQGVAGIKGPFKNPISVGGQSYDFELKIKSGADRLLGRVVEIEDRCVISFEYFDKGGKLTGH